MHTAGIRIEGLRKRFGSGDTAVDALKDVNMVIAPGEVVGLVGPSGSGKSTLLKCLGAVVEPSAGRMTIGDELIYDNRWAIKDLRALRRDKIGFIFQHYHLIDDLKVWENLDLPLQYRDVPARERASRVADLLDRFQIVGKKDLYPSQLSGGQQQLVAVARAVITRPRLLLADEPTGALHSGQARIIMDLLGELHGEGMSIVQVTHNEAFAAEAQRIIRLRDGWIETP